MDTPVEPRTVVQSTPDLDLATPPNFFKHNQHMMNPPLINLLPTTFWPHHQQPSLTTNQSSYIPDTMHDIPNLPSTSIINRNRNTNTINLPPIPYFPIFDSISNNPPSKSYPNTHLLPPPQPSKDIHQYWNNIQQLFNANDIPSINAIYNDSPHYPSSMNISSNTSTIADVTNAVSMPLPSILPPFPIIHDSSSGPNVYSNVGNTKETAIDLLCSSPEPEIQIIKKRKKKKRKKRKRRKKVYNNYNVIINNMVTNDNNDSKKQSSLDNYPIITDITIESNTSAIVSTSVSVSNVVQNKEIINMDINVKIENINEQLPNDACSNNRISLEIESMDIVQIKSMNNAHVHKAQSLIVKSVNDVVSKKSYSIPLKITQNLEKCDPNLIKMQIDELLKNVQIHENSDKKIKQNTDKVEQKMNDMNEHTDVVMNEHSISIENITDNKHVTETLITEELISDTETVEIAEFSLLNLPILQTIPKIENTVHALQTKHASISCSPPENNQFLFMGALPAPITISTTDEMNGIIKQVIQDIIHQIIDSIDDVPMKDIPILESFSSKNEDKTSTIVINPSTITKKRKISPIKNLLRTQSSQPPKKKRKLKFRNSRLKLQLPKCTIRDDMECYMDVENVYKLCIIVQIRPSSVLKRQNTNSKCGFYEYYVHYYDYDQRLDEWVTASQLRPARGAIKKPSELFNTARRLTRSQRKALEDSHHIQSCTLYGGMQTSVKKKSLPMTRMMRSISDISHMKSHHARDIVAHTSDTFGNKSGRSVVETEKIEQVYQQTNKVKNINRIQFGLHVLINSWYYSPYPEEYGRSVDILYVCEFCLKYFLYESSLKYHLQYRCVWRHPPGNEIYRDVNHCISVFEVDGATDPIARLFCQNLCLLAKLFFNHKTLYFEVNLFVFYIVCMYDECGYHMVGYFSKEKISDEDFNLACILTMPHKQKLGFGRFIIKLSYELTRRENKLGSPEKPLSDLGKIAYYSFWIEEILRLLKLYDGDITCDKLSILTRFTMEDIMIALREVNMITCYKGSTQIVYKEREAAVNKYLSDWNVSAMKRKYKFDAKCLNWSGNLCCEQSSSVVMCERKNVGLQNGIENDGKELKDENNSRKKNKKHRRHKKKGHFGKSRSSSSSSKSDD